jgi:putative DNA methylase
MKKQRTKVFIEKIMPVKMLNEQVQYENGGNPFKGLHRWYSRKPLSFSRASILASLLPADVTKAEFAQLLGIVPNGDTKLYKTTPSDVAKEKLHALCEKTWGKSNPTILDAFAGGGSIPFEAARYGLNVLASDLNPVAVVTMKAAMEYPLKFGAGLQVDIDKWVKWVGDEAETRLAEFFPNPDGETAQNYLWAHTVVCPCCESIVPLSPNWWLSKTSNYAGKGQARKVTSDWYAVKPIPNPQQKRVDFELVKGAKGSGATIVTEDEEYDPDLTVSIGRGVGKCPNCSSVIEDDVIKAQAQAGKFGHQLYAVAYKRGKGSLEFRTPTEIDLAGVERAEEAIKDGWENLIPDVEVYAGLKTDELLRYGIDRWSKLFNPRQLLTLVTYVDIIQQAKAKIRLALSGVEGAELGKDELDRANAVITYLALVLDRCVDANCRLSHWDSSRGGAKRASAQHSLNLMWNYPETNGAAELWNFCSDAFTSDYQAICTYLGAPSSSTNPTIPGFQENLLLITSSLLLPQISQSSADSLFHIPDESVDAIITDPPYYGTIQYAELSDFFYVWMKRVLDDVYPELFYSELTDKDREAVANPSRFRNMGAPPEMLARADYEAKMLLAFNEYHRVLRPDGVMTVQFNHKDPGAWDVLANSLINGGFEITASWSVSTENPQNLHQAKKNSVASTVLLVCRKRDPEAGLAWWDDLRPQVVNIVEERAVEFEANDITGIDLYLSAFGPALNVFSSAFPILDSSGEPVRPEVAFAEARRAIANYRFRKLVQTDTAGFDPLTQWYLLAWDAFKAREFVFDEARQLALAIGGFNVEDLSKVYKLITSTGGNCKLLTPKERLKKRAFSVDESDFSSLYLVDALHALIAIYEEEHNPQLVRRFMQNTGLMESDALMKTMEIALKVFPTSTSEYAALVSLRLAMDEIKAKVVVEQLSLSYG